MPAGFVLLGLLLAAPVVLRQQQGWKLMAGLGPLLAVVLLAAVDPFVTNGLPFRQREAIAAMPEAYDHAPEARPVLDIYGTALDDARDEVEMWTRNLACYYQVHHRRPLFELCMGTGTSSPRRILDKWLSWRLMAMEPGKTPEVWLERVRDDLASVGVGAVALHADFYTTTDLHVMVESLTMLLGEPVASCTTGGERVVLFHVPEGDGEPGDVKAAFAAIAKQDKSAKVTPRNRDKRPK